MRSIYRIKRLAIASLPGGSRSQAVRPLSTTSAVSFRPATRALSDGGAEKWSDRGERELPAPPGAGAGASASTSGSNFFTASHPFPHTPPPASPSDASALQTLYPLLYRSPSERDEELCTSIWRVYHRISPSTRRSLHPTIQRMILRAVIPSYASRSAFKRRAQDSVRAFAAQSARYERRLQVVVADMVRSTWASMNPDTTATIAVEPVPSRDDYRYAMSILAHLGGTEACEAIYREITHTLDANPASAAAAGPLRATLLSYRLRALKVWMTERLDVKDWTHNRPQMAQAAPVLRSLRWRADRESRNPVQHATTVLWDILREIGDGPAASTSTSTTPHKAYGELVVVLRRILEFLPDTEITVRTTLQKILQQALERGYGIDFRFLRQDPAYQTDSAKPGPVLPSVLDAVMYLMGSRGDVWRMTAMYESLTDPRGSAESSSTNVDNAESEDEEVVETLSSALQAEAVSRESLDWLGRARARARVAEEADGPSATTPIVRDLPPHLTTVRPGLPTDLRHYDDFIPSVTPPFIASTVPPPSTSTSEDLTTADYPLPRLPVVQVDTITSMLRAVRQTGQVDLAVHLLRTVLRDAAATRNTWLSHVLRNTGTEADEADPSLAKWATQRCLLVSASWFETVHLLARTQPNATPVATLLRTMMEAEIQSIQEEYLLLTGSNDVQESLDDVSPEAPIHRIPFAPESDVNGKSFDARRHLQQLQRTHTDLLKLLAISVHQVEQRRLLTAARNARRAERAAEAARQEAERVEAKKAGRRKREEVLAEATLSLA